MPLRLATAPANPVIVELNDLMEHCRVDSDEEAVLLAALEQTAVQYLDGNTGIIGRSLLTQTWELYLDEFPGAGGEVDLPLPPVQSVTSITYVDGAGVTQTLDSSKYDVNSYGTNAKVRPAWGCAWPSTKTKLNAVKITYIAGYGAAEAVPEPIKLAIKMLVAHWFENRENVAPGAANLAEIPMSVTHLIAPYRVVFFA